MANISLFGTKLVWPSSAAGHNLNHRFSIGKNIFGRKSYATVNSYMIVVYGKKPGTSENKFYLFSYATKPRKSFSPSRPNIMELYSGVSQSSSIASKATMTYSAPASDWKNSGNNVNFKLIISVKVKNEAPQVITETITGTIA